MRTGSCDATVAATPGVASMTNAMADVSIGGSLAEPSGANPEGQTADQAAAATLDSSGETMMTNLALGH